VAARRFREDLYFRLSVFPITVPPLRERPGDVPILARYFVERFCRDMKKAPITLSPMAIDALKEYRWPGNVRELQNCIERAVILADGDQILPRHLNLSFVQMEPEAVSPFEQFDLSGSLYDVVRRVSIEVERYKIQQTLKEVDNNKGRAAELLQVPYKTFMARLKELRID
jgi:DNA-binding NtrC family response regulator